ncbi:Hpt domain-containing protein [Magnetococcales bacterium HHB-1]
MINLDKIWDTVDQDKELLLEVIDLFFDDAPNLVQRMRDGLDQNDAEAVLEAAHSLKGAASAFGKTPVYHLTLAIEQMSREKNLRDAEAKWSSLQTELTVMKDDIQEALKTL